MLLGENKISTAKSCKHLHNLQEISHFAIENDWGRCARDQSPTLKARRGEFVALVSETWRNEKAQAFRPGTDPYQNL